MSSKSKSKGNRFERELCDSAIEHGFEKTRRAWGSNGRALGWDEEVDMVVQMTQQDRQFPVQAKVRKTLPAYLQIPDCCEAVAFKQDRGPKMILISWEDYLEFCQLRTETSAPSTMSN